MYTRVSTHTRTDTNLRRHTHTHVNTHSYARAHTHTHVRAHVHTYQNSVHARQVPVIWVIVPSSIPNQVSLSMSGNWGADGTDSAIIAFVAVFVTLLFLFFIGTLDRRLRCCTNVWICELLKRSCEPSSVHNPIPVTTTTWICVNHDGGGRGVLICFGIFFWTLT